MNLYQLQNGSDIRGISIESNLGPVTLNASIAKLLARGFVTYLQKKTNKQELCISVGHDSRLSADILSKGIIEGLLESGAKVFNTHLSSTPSMFMTTIFDEFKCDGAIMITASHLPFNRNGMKFFDRDGGLNANDIKTIITYADTLEFKDADNGNVLDADLLSIYSDHLKNIIKQQVNADDYDHPLKGMHIIVDAGNGAGGFYATKVLQPLGANIKGSQFLDPDGNFPNHIPNPEDKTAMESICLAVKKHHADLGIIFDTDVDRSSAVDRFGNEISRNAIIALASALLVDEHPYTTIVSDSITSNELHEFLENHLGIHHLRYKRGYKNVINKAIELNHQGIDCQLAIETSGHAALKENYFLDDGAYLATKIIIKAAKLFMENKSIDMLIHDLKHPLEACELRIHIKSSDFSAYGDNVLSYLRQYAQNHDDFHPAIKDYEGIRVSFDQDHGNGWFLLRKSLHDPILPVNIESNSLDGCKVIIRSLYQAIKHFNELDMSVFEKWIKD